MRLNSESFKQCIVDWNVYWQQYWNLIDDTSDKLIERCAKNRLSIHTSVSLKEEKEWKLQLQKAQELDLFSRYIHNFCT